MKCFHINGTNRARTYDPLLVRQMLSQLSYDPMGYEIILKWTFRDSNPGPIGYEPIALTN